VVIDPNLQITFLLYSPLNQGLKRSASVLAEAVSELFLLYSPLNQGLKLNDTLVFRNCINVFTLQSIKSRIETNRL